MLCLCVKLKTILRNKSYKLLVQRDRSATQNTNGSKILFQFHFQTFQSNQPVIPKSRNGKNNPIMLGFESFDRGDGLRNTWRSECTLTESPSALSTDLGYLCTLITLGPCKYDTYLYFLEWKGKIAFENRDVTKKDGWFWKKVFDVWAKSSDMIFVKILENYFYIKNW